eukprot:gb/GFBE01035952.1/.p1 GENE.gb/GFBE01035952.1/~~gb/GFBE01035952.1/.p1  ORF type:complete len:256 (+),score=50.49 gb/GFBE01035952.1/:1-768(+)
MTASEDAVAGADGAEDVSPGSAKDVEQVVQSLLESTSDREVCLGCCKVLEAATLRSTNCQRRVLSCKGPEALVATMSAHLQDAEVQMYACRTLQHLASLGASEGPLVLAKAGACKAASESMASHPADATVQQAACHAIELIAFGGAEPRAQAHVSGCAQAVLKGLQQFRKDAAVQEANLAALQALIHEEPECREAVTKAGGLAAIIGALADHRDNAQVQYWGEVLLAGLCRDNAELRQEAMRKCHFQKLEIDFDI